MGQDYINFRVPKRTLHSAVCVLIGGLITSAGVSFADNDTSTQTILGGDLVMPYDGYLMVDSAPLTGVRTIKFQLYQSADAAAIAVWSETQTVELYNGRFSVGLGSATSLTSTILDAEKLYLGMTIIENDAQGNAVEVELSGRQAIEPAPFAAWSGNSTDLNVGNNLNVANAAVIGTTANIGGDTTIGGIASIGGDTSVGGALDVTGAATIGGDVTLGDNALRFTDTNNATITLSGIDSTYTDDGITLRTLNNPSSNEPIFRVMSSGGSERLRVEHDGRLYTTNSFEADGAGTFGGNVGITGTITTSGAGTIGGNLQVNGGTTLGNASSDDTTIKGDLTVDGDITNFSMSGEYRVASGDGDGTNLKSGSTKCMSGTQRSPGSSCSNSSTGSAYDLGSTSNKICFLTGTGFEDVDSNGERGFCNVYVSGSNWYLAANTDTGDANMWCNARCLSW